MNAKAVWVLGAALIILGGIYIFSKREPSETGPIKIGAIAPLTGDAAAIGSVARAGIELAVEEINAAGGINGRELHVTYEDGQCNAQAANSAATKLIDIDKVSAIVGGVCSTETAAFAPKAMQSKVVVISECSSAPSLTGTGAYFFRVYPSDAYQGIFAAEYAYNTLGARNVAILYHNNDWGMGIKDVFVRRFQELGGKIVVEEGATQTETDYRTQLSKIATAKPDHIYAPTYPAGGTILLKQASDMGLRVPVLGGDAWSDTKFQADVAGIPFDILFAQSKPGSDSSFSSKLLAKTGGQEVPLCAPQAYDATYVLADALKRAGTDPDRLADAIRATNRTGVSGRISFDQNGDMTSASYVVMRVKNGSITEAQ